MPYCWNAGPKWFIPTLQAWKLLFSFPSKSLRDSPTPFAGKLELDSFVPSPWSSTRKPPTRMPEEPEQIAPRRAALQIPRAARLWNTFHRFWHKWERDQEPTRRKVPFVAARPLPKSLVEDLTWWTGQADFFLQLFLSHLPSFAFLETDALSQAG